MLLALLLAARVAAHAVACPQAETAATATPQETTAPAPPPAAVPLPDVVNVALDVQRPLAERLAALESLLVGTEKSALDARALAALAKGFQDKGRREAVALLERLLADAARDDAAIAAVAELAAQLPDPSYAPALLARLDAAAATGRPPATSVVTALRAAHDAMRRRWIEGEEERIAKASPEALFALLDHAEPALRRAALVRLVEHAQRPDAVRSEPFEKSRPVLATRLEAALAREPMPGGNEELRRLAELAILVEPAATSETLRAAYAATPSDARRITLLPALRRLAGGPHASGAAQTVAQTLAEGRIAATTNAYAEAALDALRTLADEAVLPVLEAAMAPALPAVVRERAIGAAAEVARRSDSAAIARTQIDRLAALLVGDAEATVRFAAALGLSQLLESVAARASAAGPESAVDRENVARIVDAMRRALPAALQDKALAEQCARVLCRDPSRAELAAQELSGALLGAEPPPAPAVREVLLNGLKELAHPAGLAAIVAQLPRGGPSVVEADPVGKAALAALLRVQKQAGERRLAVDLEIVERFLAVPSPEWALSFVAPLIDGVRNHEEAEAQHAIRLLYARTALAALDASRYERAFEECEWVALQERADAPAGRLAREVLVELAERIGAPRALDAALYARDLRRVLDDPAARAALDLRVARLLFAAGEWEAAYRALDAIDERSAPLDAVILRARAAARRDDVNALRDALRLHELLLGAAGAGGGRLPAEAVERVALSLTLAGLLLDAGRDADSVALLARLPAADALAPELQPERRRLDERAAAANGGG